MKILGVTRSTWEMVLYVEVTPELRGEAGGRRREYGMQEQERPLDPRRTRMDEAVPENTSET